MGRPSRGARQTQSPEEPAAPIASGTVHSTSNGSSRRYGICPGGGRADGAGGWEAGRLSRAAARGAAKAAR